MKRNEKKITREVTETVVTFIASDGKEFKNEEDCEKYEESYVCTLKTCFEKVPHLEKAATSLYIQYGTEEDEAYMLIPRNMEDVCAVNRILDYCDGVYGSIGTDRLTQDDIKKAVLINFGCEGIEGGWYTLLRKDEYLKKITKELNEYEEKINFNVFVDNVCRRKQ